MYSSLQCYIFLQFWSVDLFLRIEFKFCLGLSVLLTISVDEFILLLIGVVTSKMRDWRDQIPVSTSFVFHLPLPPPP